jgi:hypothetical protein
MRHAYGNADGDGNIHANGDSDSNSHSHANGDCDSDIYCDGYGYGHSDGYSNCDRIAAVYTDATASADAGAACGQLL